MIDRAKAKEHLKTEKKKIQRQRNRRYKRTLETERNRNNFRD